MSLTISPQSLPPGFNPKAYPIVPPSKEVSSSSGVSTNSTSTDVQVDLSHLEVMKIIPDEGPHGDNKLYSNKSLINNKTILNNNADSDQNYDDF